MFTPYNTDSHGNNRMLPSTSNNSPNQYAHIAPCPQRTTHAQTATNTFKSNRACDTCKQKKIKCRYIEDVGSCGNCSHFGKRCTFDRSIKKRGPPKGYIAQLEDRLKRIENLVESIPKKYSGTVAGTFDLKYQLKDNNAARMNQTRQVGLDAQSIDTLSDISASKLLPKHLRISANFIDEGQFIRESSIVKLICKGQFSLSIKKRILSQLGFDTQYLENDGYFDIEKSMSDEALRNLQVEELAQVGIIQPSESIHTVDEWIYKSSGIHKKLSDRLLKIYFAFIHPLLPVVNKTEFLREYRGISHNFPAAVLLNAIFGATVRYIENCKKFNDLERLNDDEPWDFPDGFSGKFQKQMHVLLNNNYKPCLATVQALIVALNHFVDVDTWTSGWILACIAVRMSQDLGLHRSPDSWNISEQEKENRKMVWWCAYVLDRWLSAGSGRPLTIFDEDCDVGYPSQNVSMDEIMDKATENDHHLPRFPTVCENEFIEKFTDETVPLYEPFIQLIKLSEMLGNVLQNLYTPYAKKYRTQYGNDIVVGYLDEALSKWRAALPPLLDISIADKRHSKTDTVPLLSMSGLICLSYCTLVILLHRPFIEALETDNTSSSKRTSEKSLEICTSAATRVVQVADSMHYRDFLLVSWGFGLYPIFTAALIHIHNCSNPDAIIADEAKSYLIRSLAIVDKLDQLTPMAKNMSEVLKRFIVISPIFLNDPDFIAALEVDTTKKLEHSYLNVILDKLQNKSHENIVDSGELHSIEENKAYDQSKGDMDMTSDESWWRQLYTPTLNNFTGTANPIVNESFAAQDLQNANQTGTSTQQPLDYFSLEKTTAPFNSIVNELNSNFTSPSLTHPKHTHGFDYHGISSPTTTTTNTFITHMSSNTIDINSSISQNDPSASFRYTSENPFWSVPSSMELEEWLEYLLPHEQQQQRKSST